MTVPRDTPSAGIDPDYAWAVGDHWLTDGDDDLDAAKASRSPLRALK